MSVRGNAATAIAMRGEGCERAFVALAFSILRLIDMETRKALRFLTLEITFTQAL